MNRHSVVNNQALLDQDFSPKQTYIFFLTFIVQGPGGGYLHIGLVGDMPSLRVFIFGKNSRMGFKVLVKIPDQAAQKPMIF